MPKAKRRLASGQIGSSELTEHSIRFLAELRREAEAGEFDDIPSPQWSSTRQIVDELSLARVLTGFYLITDRDLHLFA
jgi:hypothetical protein